MLVGIELLRVLHCAQRSTKQSRYQFGMIGAENLNLARISSFGSTNKEKKRLLGARG